MKKSLFFLFLPALLFGTSFFSLDLQVEKWQAEQQNEQIEKLYQKLLEEAITDWQRARIYYNLGTVYLSQNLPKESLQWLEKIQPVDLSLPRLGDRLLYNRSVAYFQLAQIPERIDEQLFYAEKGLLITHNELFTDLFEKGKKLLLLLRKQKREEWLKNADPSTPAEREYHLLVLSEEITEQEVKNFIEKKYDWSPSIQKNLDRALEAFRAKKERKGRFFLLLGLSLVESQKEKVSFSSKELLKSLVQQAEYSLQLLFLSILSSDSSLLPFLKQQQETVIAIAQTWIPQVLEEQKKEFSRGPCQELPWKVVIPLFGRGYNISLSVQKKWLQKEVRLAAFIEEEKKIVDAWQEALRLFEDAPSSSNRVSSSQSVQEELRVLQEMYLEDQKKRSVPSQEFQGW